MGSGPVRFGPIRLWVAVGSFVLATAPVPPAAAQPGTDEARPVPGAEAAPPIAPEAIPAPEPPPQDVPVFPDAAPPAVPALPAPAATPEPAAPSGPPVPAATVPAPETVPAPAAAPDAAAAPVPPAAPPPVPEPAPPTPAAPLPEPARTPPAAAPVMPPPSVQAPAAPAPGRGGATAASGEGGEGGEGEGGEADALLDAPPDVAFAGRLMQVRGHLAVAMELARAGAWDDAVFHVLHPREEVYGALEPELRRRRAPGFLPELDALTAHARARRGGRGLEQAYYRAQVALDRAFTAGLPARVRYTPAFLVEVAARTLRAAAAEYGAAIEGGRIVNVVEYQDGRGFLREADALLTHNAAALRGAVSAGGPGGGAAAWAELQAAMAPLRANWPSARPPEAPVMSAAALDAAVARVERAALAWR